MQLDPNQAADPLALFDHWLAQAAETEPNDPNAAALATATVAAAPSVRMVLVKRIGDLRFCVFTNAEGRKGRELAQNPHAALCFHWKSLRRQVRVEGPIAPLPAAASDAYFHSRSRSSQIGAIASQQSRPLATRAELEARAAAVAAQYPESQSPSDDATQQIPRPSYWRGFLVWPQRVEFWQDGPHRLHDRAVFERTGNLWTRTRLYP